MVQSGRITEPQIWQKLYAGFQRGLKGTRKVQSETLLQASQSRGKGGRYGRTMRIYWSGAAYFLIADWQLLKVSGGKQGLSDVLLKLNQCCIDSSKQWSGAELANKLDELSKTEIFSSLYDEISNSKEFPSTGEVFEALGIKIIDDKFHFLSGEQEKIRSSIINP